MQATSIKPLALFGGTFDPIHYGHLRCADDARRQLNLDTVYLLPAGHPPHRGPPQATSRQRLDMMCHALLEFPDLRIDKRELDRSGPSFMADTLQELRVEFPQRPLLLLLGQDAVNYLHTWHCWQKLFDLSHIIILTRPKVARAYPDELEQQIQRREITDLRDLKNSAAGRVLKLEVAANDISATIIKETIRAGRSPHSMLPEAVLQYINTHDLYQCA